MRILMTAAALVGLSGAVLAADGPTKEQCKAGWKAEYSKMWTPAQFKSACKSMM